MEVRRDRKAWSCSHGRSTGIPDGRLVNLRGIAD